MSDDDWLYGRDGHISRGEEILASWQVKDPDWRPARGGGWISNPKEWRKPAAEGCECAGCIVDRAVQLADSAPIWRDRAEAAENRVAELEARLDAEIDKQLVLFKENEKLRQRIAQIDEQEDE